MRRSIRVERHLDVPPEALFEILADHARYDRFEGIRLAEVVKPGDPEPNGLGALRRIWIGPLRFEEEITAYEPPSRLDYLIVDLRGVPFRHEGGSIRLSPADGGGTDAVWTSSFEIPIPVLGRALDGAFKLRLERGFRETLERSAELAARASTARA